jgi:divalent metal cation (Fe/Co/Zn/Cd) transporter
MPLLARAKLRVGQAIGSAALVADAKCSMACAWLSVTVLVGLALNVALGWWWADPVAALCMVPFLVREGREALEAARGKETPCSCHGGCSSS